MIYTQELEMQISNGKGRDGAWMDDLFIETVTGSTMGLLLCRNVLYKLHTAPSLIKPLIRKIQEKAVPIGLSMDVVSRLVVHHRACQRLICVSDIFSVVLEEMDSHLSKNMCCILQRLPSDETSIPFILDMMRFNAQMGDKETYRSCIKIFARSNNMPKSAGFVMAWLSDIGRLDMARSIFSSPVKDTQTLVKRALEVRGDLVFTVHPVPKLSRIQ